MRNFLKYLLVIVNLLFFSTTNCKAEDIDYNVAVNATQYFLKRFTVGDDVVPIVSISLQVLDLNSGMTPLLKSLTLTNFSDEPNLNKIITNPVLYYKDLENRKEGVIPFTISEDGSKLVLNLSEPIPLDRSTHNNVFADFINDGSLTNKVFQIGLNSIDDIEVIDKETSNPMALDFASFEFKGIGQFELSRNIPVKMPKFDQEAIAPKILHGVISNYADPNSKLSEFYFSPFKSSRERGFYNGVVVGRDVSEFNLFDVQLRYENITNQQDLFIESLTIERKRGQVPLNQVLVNPRMERFVAYGDTNTDVNLDTDIEIGEDSITVNFNEPIQLPTYSLNALKVCTFEFITDIKYIPGLGGSFFVKGFKSSGIGVTSVEPLDSGPKIVLNKEVNKPFKINFSKNPIPNIIVSSFKKPEDKTVAVGSNDVQVANFNMKLSDDATDPVALERISFDLRNAANSFLDPHKLPRKFFRNIYLKIGELQKKISVISSVASFSRRIRVRFKKPYILEPGEDKDVQLFVSFAKDAQQVGKDFQLAAQRFQVFPTFNFIRARNTVKPRAYIPNKTDNGDNLTGDNVIKFDHFTFE